MERVLRARLSFSQSVLFQSGAGGGVRMRGRESFMRMGMWSDPVAERVVSQEEKKGWRAALAKARSRTAGRDSESKGNRVWMPGVLRRL